MYTNINYLQLIICICVVAIFKKVQRPCTFKDKDTVATIDKWKLFLFCLDKTGATYIRPILKIKLNQKQLLRKLYVCF